MKRGPNPKDVIAFRGFISSQGKLGVYKPPVSLSLKTVFSNVSQGKPYEFIYMVYIERILPIVPIEVYEKYIGTKHKKFLSNPKSFGVKIYKGFDQEVHFK